MTLLQPGWIVEYAGEPHRVTLVNESRAVLQRVRGEQREFRTAAGEVIHIKAAGPTVSISPRSEIPILDLRSATIGEDKAS